MVLPPPQQKNKKQNTKTNNHSNPTPPNKQQKTKPEKKNQTDDQTGLQFKIVFADRLQNLPGSICSVAETVFPYKALQRDFN